MAFFQRPQDRPPENCAGDEKTQVLEDVQSIVRERCIE